MAYGPGATAPNRELRKKLRDSGYKTYIDGTLCRA